MAIYGHGVYDNPVIGNAVLSSRDPGEIETGSEDRFIKADGSITTQPIADYQTLQDSLDSQLM